MIEDLELYTGTMEFRNIVFQFVFDRKEVRLIPPDDKKHTIEFDWHMKKLREGVYTIGDPIYIESPYLVGACNETGHKIVFITEKQTSIGFINDVLYFYTKAYIINKYDKELIDRISISCPEINYIYPVNQGFDLKCDPDELLEKGVLSIESREYKDTITAKESFVLDNKSITTYFGITRTASTKISKTPIQFASSLEFEFDPISDYSFIIDICHIARDFIMYLCYRRNIHITDVNLSAPCENGKHEHFATLFFVDQDGSLEERALKDKRYIMQSRISGHIGEILSDIQSDGLYLRHIPDSYSEGRHITAARFVMIMAAFEWEFCRLYPDGIKKSEEQLSAEKEVKTVLNDLRERSTGKKKTIYKRLCRNVSLDSLANKILFVGKELYNVIDLFGQHLYKLNNEELNYSEIGLRLAKQRNHFAHGDLDKEFIGLSLLDLVFMEYIIYAMQLRYYGVDDQNIKKAINELFHLSFAL